MDETIHCRTAEDARSSMNGPHVTVLVPIFNGSAHLSETLHSLLAQTFSNFELLAIDDGSSDSSSDIVRSLDDRRVRLIRKENSGLCETLNLGIAEARAAYIARCDQDDISFPKRLEHQLEVMNKHPEAIGLFAYTTKFGKKHGWANADKVVMAPGEVKQFRPMEDGGLLGSTMFVRTDALRSIGGFRQAYYPADDWDLELRLAEFGKVLVLREPVIAYRFHASANTYRVFADMCQKVRWAEDSYLRRLKSGLELSLDRFRLEQSRSVWARMRRYRKDLSRLHMRMAGQRYLDGRYVSCGAHLSASALLHPAEAIRRVKRYFGRS